MTDPDRKLARRAGRGDQEALAGLYERYRGRVFGFLVRLCGRQSAEDVFQEVWLHVLRHMDDFDPQRGTFSAWIHGIAAHAAIDRVRRERVRAAEPLDVPSVESGPGRGNLVASREPSPELLAMAAPLRAAIAAALLRLEPSRRAAVLLRHHLGMTYAEVAAAIGVPEGTAKSMIHRGVLDLRSALEEWSDDRP